MDKDQILIILFVIISAITVFGGLFAFDYMVQSDLKHFCEEKNGGKFIGYGQCVKGDKVYEIVDLDKRMTVAKYRLVR